MQKLNRNGAQYWANQYALYSMVHALESAGLSTDDPAPMQRVRARMLQRFGGEDGWFKRDIGLSKAGDRDSFQPFYQAFMEAVQAEYQGSRLPFDLRDNRLLRQVFDAGVAGRDDFVSEYQKHGRLMLSPMGLPNDQREKLSAFADVPNYNAFMVEMSELHARYPGINLLSHPNERYVDANGNVIGQGWDILESVSMRLYEAENRRMNMLDIAAPGRSIREVQDRPFVSREQMLSESDVGVHTYTREIVPAGSKPVTFDRGVGRYLCAQSAFGEMVRELERATGMTLSPDQAVELRNRMDTLVKNAQDIGIRNDGSQVNRGFASLNFVLPDGVSRDSLDKLPANSHLVRFRNVMLSSLRHVNPEMAAAARRLPQSFQTELLNAGMRGRDNVVNAYQNKSDPMMLLDMTGIRNDVVGEYQGYLNLSNNSMVGVHLLDVQRQYPDAGKIVAPDTPGTSTQPAFWKMMQQVPVVAVERNANGLRPTTMAFQHRSQDYDIAVEQLGLTRTAEAVRASRTAQPQQQRPAQQPVQQAPASPASGNPFNSPPRAPQVTTPPPGQRPTPAAPASARPNSVPSAGAQNDPVYAGNLAKQLFSSNVAEAHAQHDYFVKHAVYHSLIQRMNDHLAENMGVDRRFLLEGVTTRTACAMLDKIGELGKTSGIKAENGEPMTFANMSLDDFETALTQVIDDTVSDEFVRNQWHQALRDSVTPDNDGQPWYASTVEEFDTALRENDVLTLSPFDINFRNRKVAMDKGHSALYVKYTYDPESGRQEGSRLPLQGGLYTDSVSDNRMLQAFKDDWQVFDKVVDSSMSDRLGFSPSMSGFGGGTKDMLWSGPEDSSGLSALRPYMSPDEYKQLSELTYDGKSWCAGCTVKTPNGERTKYMSTESIERVRKIVDMLKMSGESFTFEADAQPGQVRAKFDNGMTLRVLDPYSENYAGNHVYYDGAVIHYQVQVSTSSSYAYPDVTPEQAVDLIKFARGESVMRRDDLSKVVVPKSGGSVPQALGATGTVQTMSAYAKTGKKYGPAVRELAYTNGGHEFMNVLVDVGNYKQRIDDRSAQPDTALVINYKYKKRSASRMTFDDVTISRKVPGEKEPIRERWDKDSPHSGAARARKYLTECVSAARTGFLEEVNLAGLIEEANVRREERDAFLSQGLEYDDAAPQRLSANPDIAAIQSKYWDVLMGRQNALLKPNYDVAEFDDEDPETDTAQYTDEERESHVYHFDNPERTVAEHLSDLTDYLIGTCEFEKTDPNSETYQLKEPFNPILVNRYMSGSNAKGVNAKNITAACKALKLGVDNLKYTSFGTQAGAGLAFQKNNAKLELVNYDEATAVNMLTADFGSERKTEFMHSIGRTIRDSLAANGCEVDDNDIMIDDNGIVHYKANRVMGGFKDRPRQLEPFEGEIGKIYAPRDDGLIKTPQFIAIPGYQARLEPNKPGENKPYEDRIVLTSYEKALQDSIRDQIRQDLMTPPQRVDGYEVVEGHVVGESFSVDSVLGKFIDIRYPLDFDDDKAIQARGMSVELRDMIIETNRTRVKFDKDLMEASNRMAVFKALNGADDERRDILNDCYMDALTLTGYRNIALLESPGDGLFDPYFTGNAGAQGVRYLVKGAEVDADGHIIRADKDARCAMVNYLVDTGRCPTFDSPDRMNMTGNGLLHCIRETEAVGVAQVTCDIWTKDDGLLVSKEFAEANMVPDAKTGLPRPLTEGDKIECHGNKGVIAKVIDREMSAEKAKEEKLESVVGWFRENPDLDVIMSPYSGVSRFNAGLAVEAIDSNPTALVNPKDGTVYDKSIGYVKMTVLEQTADTKTHVDKDGGDGRAYGAQMTWALAANDSLDVMKDAFQKNFKASSNLREMMLTMGLDLDPTGRFQMGYHPQPDEVRKVFELQDVKMYEHPSMAKSGNGKATFRMHAVDKRAMKDSFSQFLNTSGGFMELPFPLEYPCKKELERQFKATEQYNKGVVPPGTGLTELYTSDKYHKDDSRTVQGQWIQQIGAEGADDAKIHEFEPVDLFAGKKTYVLPVMSSYLRAGQEFGDGALQVHDYTRHYMDIYESVLTYQQAALREAWLKDSKDRLWNSFEAEARGNAKYPDRPQTAQAVYEAALADCGKAQQTAQKDAQKSFNKITRDLETRRFAGKHNIFRSSVMSNRQPRSCTAIWTPDSRLSVHEIGMGSNMMQSLNVKEGDWVLIHRDPVLRGSALRYMQVKEDKSLIGISVHPSGVPKGMDGDFDGDTAGVRAMSDNDRAARSDAAFKLSVKSHLLDYSAADPETGIAPLFIDVGQDVAAGMNKRPELREKLDQITKDVNEFERTLSGVELDEKRVEAIQRINDFMDECGEACTAAHVMSYASKTANIRSVEQYVQEGVKGKTSGLDIYAHCMGVTYERGEDGQIIESTIEEHDKNMASREMLSGVLEAKNMQNQYTGMAGAATMSFMANIMCIAPEVGTQIGHAATQSVLQVKHDPRKAARYELLLCTAVKDLRKGIKLEPCKADVTFWDCDAKVLDKDGNEVIDPRTGEPRTGKFVVEQLDTWKPVLDEEGKYVACSTEEYIKQFDDIYNSAKGLEVDLHPQYIEALAKILTDDKGVVMSMERNDNKAPNKSFKDTYGSPLQRLAYGGNAKLMYQMAFSMERGEMSAGLFDVPDVTKARFKDQVRDVNKCIADGSTIRRNLDIRDKCQARDIPLDTSRFVPVIRQDVVEGNNIRIRKALVDDRLMTGMSLDTPVQETPDYAPDSILPPKPDKMPEQMPVYEYQAPQETREDDYAFQYDDGYFEGLEAPQQEELPPLPGDEMMPWDEEPPAPAPMQAPATQPPVSLDLSRSVEPESVPEVPVRSQQQNGCAFDLGGLDVNSAESGYESVRQVPDR